MTHIEQFPDEILLNILCYLPRQEIIHSISLVSCHWNQLSCDGVFSQQLFLKETTPLHIISQLAVRKPTVRILKSTRLESLSNTLPIIGSGFRHLVCLNVAYSKFDLDAVSVANAVRNLYNLRHLNLDSCSQLEDTLLEMMSNSLPHVEIWNLSHCRFITEEGIITSSRHLKCIQRLNLEGVHYVSDHAVKCLVAGHSHFLEGIWLDASNLTSQTFDKLGRCLHLTILCITFCDEITDDGLLKLLNLNDLRILSLEKGSRFTQDGLISLFSNCKWQKLTRLSLTECSALNNSVVDKIVDLCSSTLILLSLNWCWDVTDPGITNIVDYMKELQYLSLIGLHNITGSEFNNLPRLAVLDLTQCNKIEDDKMIEIRRVKPSLIIYNYYGLLVSIDEQSDDGFESNFSLWQKINDFGICNH